MIQGEQRGAGVDGQRCAPGRPDLRIGRSWWGLASGVALVLLVGACSDEVIIPNHHPSAAIEAVELSDDGPVDIYFELSDADGDDLSIAVRVCSAGDCFAPTPAPGGDGVRDLPTEPDAPVLHLFRWAAGCDVGAEDLEATRTVEIVPNDGEDAGAPAVSPEFSLSELGMSEPGECPGS